MKAQPRGDKALVCVPALKAMLIDSQRVVLTQKFVDGMAEYARHWSGPIRVIMAQTNDAGVNLDNTEYYLKELPFELRVLPSDDPTITDFIRGAAVFMGTPDDYSFKIADRCKLLGIPTLFTFEFSFRTRMQVIQAQTSNPLLRLRRYMWQLGQERRNFSAVMSAAGIQCNGTPTYDAYKRLNRNTMLFFDSRVTKDLVIQQTALDQKVREMGRLEHIRLAFSGRLDEIKGVRYLVPLACALRKRGVLFRMTIMGAGPLYPSLAQQITDHRLGPLVEMTGVLDFKRELIPRMQQEIDLFICPHIQGDPSCTYLETLSCGVPILGFDNDAFRGLLRHGEIGWSVPVHDVNSMADTIVHLTRCRAVIADRARTALMFARQHTFESTFRDRVEHMQACAKACRLCNANLVQPMSWRGDDDLEHRTRATRSNGSLPD